MKAWVVDSGCVSDGCLLVYAETCNKARYASLDFAIGFMSEYEYVRARRSPMFDHWYTSKKIVSTNEELPNDAPKFYCEEEF